MRRVERGRGGARAAHEWRKRVKDLRYAAEILGLRPLAGRADRLAELLGEEHDLVVLAGLLPPPGRGPFKGKRGRRARRALLKRIARRRAAPAQARAARRRAPVPAQAEEVPTTRARRPQENLQDLSQMPM